MHRRRTRQHIVLPIFYHVDPSDVQNLSGSFKTSFDDHESNGLRQVKQWKKDFAQVGSLTGIHIEDDDKPETDHIKHIAEYAMQKLMKHQVFLSLGEDTRLNFSSHLLKALECTGINVFSNKAEIQFSQAIAASNLSIIVLSKDYASSESCLVQLSDIIGRKRTQKHIIIPIFYHVDPSDVRNLGGSFKASFDDHESIGLCQVQKWKKDFVEVGKLKGCHIEVGKFDRPDTEYIKDVVQYILKMLDRKSRSISDDLVGLDDQKEMILSLIEQKDSRVLGFWGMGGIGKTTLADVVYNEISYEFQSHDKIDIDTPSIGSPLTQKRLKNKRVFVVLDDVNDSDLMDLMGVKYFGKGSKIIVTSRDRQVLKNGGADKIHKVNRLNENDSLQLFSTFAFKLLNHALDFQDLSNKFLEYAQGNPLALKVLGSKLYTKSKKEWEGEVDKLKQYPQQKISQILKSSFDELDELEKNIFLDIACFFKRDHKEDVEEFLSCLYKGAACGISNLLDKCLVHIDSYRRISMHDMLEEMGKDIILQRSKHPEKQVGYGVSKT
ncbi:hypothetical protein F3Y22_tig00112249pilonHSYRG00337 [Hibiscus syriacus]|uniref:TIR domain-containing protein n=1 Tax=Hibiscus syriacus TaxID=106335 RepID=A0A6A2X3M3_HIBSY|nr:hypothetical protein F3Y22_tig00112249pilonHSYRG00337 [Hibiscus syriacus]